MSEHIVDRIDAYVFGDVTPEAAAAIDAHAQTCAPCRTALGEARAVFDVLPHALEPIEPPRRVLDGILSRIADEAAAGGRVKPAKQPNAVLALAACLALALAGDGILGARLTIPAGPAPIAKSGQTSSRVVAALEHGRVYSVNGTVGHEAWQGTVVQPGPKANALLFTRAPGAPRGRTFKVWVLRGKRSYSIARVLPHVDTAIEMPMPLEAGDVVAFSEEANPASTSPTAPYLMKIAITQ